MATKRPAIGGAGNRVIRSSLDIGGGLFLLGLAIVGYVGGFSLPFGQLSGIGSGLLPKVVAVLVAAFGVALLVQGFLSGGDQSGGQWAIRGPIFVLERRDRVRLHHPPVGAGCRRAPCGHRLRARRQGHAARGGGDPRPGAYRRCPA